MYHPDLTPAVRRVTGIPAPEISPIDTVERQVCRIVSTGLSRVTRNSFSPSHFQLEYTISHARAALCRFATKSCNLVTSPAAALAQSKAKLVAGQSGIFDSSSGEKLWRDTCRKSHSV